MKSKSILFLSFLAASIQFQAKAANGIDVLNTWISMRYENCNVEDDEIKEHIKNLSGYNIVKFSALIKFSCEPNKITSNKTSAEAISCYSELDKLFQPSDKMRTDLKCKEKDSYKKLSQSAPKKIADADVACDPLEKNFKYTWFQKRIVCEKKFNCKGNFTFGDSKVLSEGKYTFRCIPIISTEVEEKDPCLKMLTLSKCTPDSYETTSWGISSNVPVKAKSVSTGTAN